MVTQSVCDETLTELIHHLNPDLVSCYHLNPDLVSGVKFENLESDCLKLFKLEQCKVKEAFLKFRGKISLVVDLLVDEKREEQYLCLSAQFINNDWKLRKWIIKYSRVLDMNMDFPSKAILKTLKEYHVKSKILTLTVGGTDDLVDIVKENVQERMKLPMNGQLFHVQCSCDIISHMAQKGFKEIEEIINKFHLLNWSNSLPLWYLTSSKLSDALGEIYSGGADNSNERPSKEELEKVRSVCKIADRIYELTKGLFAFERPTSNLFLPYLVEIRVYLAQESAGSDSFVRRVAHNMLEIFNKYWDDMSSVLCITAFLDPRYKMKFVGFCLSDSDAATVLENIRKIYDSYALQYDQNDMLSNSSFESEEEEDDEGYIKHLKHAKRNLGINLNVIKEYYQSMQYTKDEYEKSDLDMYLEEPVLPWMEDFSVLHWWKKNCFNYPRLSRMARDFLAIPLSVETSYNAYYTDPRKADLTSLSLKPELINALKCTRSWNF